MAKSALSSKTSRQRLPAGKKLFERVTQFTELGYLRGKVSGSWYFKQHERGQQPRERVIGKADDLFDANGVGVLDYNQARERVQERSGEVIGEKRRYTGVDGCRDVVEHARLNSSFGAMQKLKSTLLCHVLPFCGRRNLEDISRAEILRFRHDLEKAPNKRPRKIDPLAGLEGEALHEAQREQHRKRLQTVDRIVADFCGMLSFAHENGHISSDRAWAKLGKLSKIKAPKTPHLTRPDLVKLLNCVDPVFQPMAWGAAFAGGRLTEARELCVRDFDPHAGRAGSVFFRHRKTGSSRYVALNPEGKQFFADRAKGRAPGDLMFPRPDGGMWGKNEGQRFMAEACERAGLPHIVYRQLRTSYGSLLAISGTPILVISKLMGHRNSKTTEDHYAHLSPEGVSDCVCEKMPSLKLVSSTAKPAA